jgi:NAD dependent epimerase/dehydratase family enzyme
MGVGDGTRGSGRYSGGHDAHGGRARRGRRSLEEAAPTLPARIGARLGRGSQQLSWITRRDVVAAISFLLDRRELSGPFNLVAPQPVTNAIFTTELGRALHRPARLVVPETAVRIALGSEMASETLFASQRAVPERLLAAGFTFSDAALPEALVTALGDR